MNKILLRHSINVSTQFARYSAPAVVRPSYNLRQFQQTKNHEIIKSSIFADRFMSTTQTVSSTVVDSNNNNSDSIFKKLMKKFGWSDNSRARLRVSSYLMYQSVADSINYKAIFSQFNLPNTFNSWFLVTELHVWMLLVRAMAEGSETGEDGRFMRNCIVEAMWADVNSRAKKLGSQNPSGVRGQIQTLSQQFQAALITYDEGIANDDIVLAGAIWRRFFEMDCDDYEQLEQMVQYVRKQIKMLDSLSRHDFAVKPKITWTLSSSQK